LPFYRQLYVCTGFMVYEIIPASSARFPYLNSQSRDRSPPRLLLMSFASRPIPNYLRL
jgi:hypothetical protein